MERREEAEGEGAEGAEGARRPQTNAGAARATPNNDGVVGQYRIVGDEGSTSASMGRNVDESSV